jgi:ATP-dependent DNA helicase RecQ
MLVTSKIKNIKAKKSVSDTDSEEKDINKDPILETFNKHFLNKTIKPLQYDIVKNILQKNNTLAILPTGFGKSICYQLPYLMNPDKIVIVISPLISLMEDQKEKLEQLNIPVACFHSNVSKRDKLLSKLDDSGKIIFLTPEYANLCNEWLQQLIDDDKLLLIAIDEAHCISTWGHDFRPDYKELHKITSFTKKIPILALTATATTQVEKEIKEFLNLEDVQVYKTSFDRPNLTLCVNKKTKEFTSMLPILDKYKNDFTIIYCKTRDKTEEIAEFLKENKYLAEVYHAGFNADYRKEVQEKFSNKEFNIIVATVAFGMGIDQDIHLIIHWGCPADMESYYQEIGRAGRDGKDSECYLFWDKDDFRISRYFLKSITDIKYRKFKDEQISKMERYCLVPACRRTTLLNHFGENLKDDHICNKCDNCIVAQTKIETNIDSLLYPIFIIMKAVFYVKCKMGAGKLNLMVRGSKSKAIVDFNKAPIYGTLKDLSEEQVKQLISIMTTNGLLKEKSLSSGFGSVLETTGKGLQWYNKVNQKDDVTFDTLQPILLDNNIKLVIPNEYANIKIKYKTSMNDLMEEFNLI